MFWQLTSIPSALSTLWQSILVRSSLASTQWQLTNLGLMWPYQRSWSKKFTSLRATCPQESKSTSKTIVNSRRDVRPANAYTAVINSTSRTVFWKRSMTGMVLTGWLTQQSKVRSHLCWSKATLRSIRASLFQRFTTCKMRAMRFSRYGSLNSRTCQTSSLPMPMVWTWSKDKYLKRLTNTFRRPSTQLMHRLRWKIMLPIELLPFGMTDHRQALCTLMANLRFWSRDAWSWAIIGTSQSLCIAMVTSLLIPSESTSCWKAIPWKSLARATGRGN